jgi:hypothetical protein
VTLVCLNWFQSLYGRWNYVLPGNKIADGSFSGWKIRAGFPFTRESITCTLSAPYGDNPFAVSAPLTIWSADSALLPVKIPFSNIHTRPASKASGFQTFRASTAPGTHLTLVIRYPHVAPVTHTVKANWNGQVSLRWPLPSSVRRGVRGKIVVSGRLGIFSGLQAVQMLARR